MTKGPAAEARWTSCVTPGLGDISEASLGPPEVPVSACCGMIVGAGPGAARACPHRRWSHWPALSSTSTTCSTATCRLDIDLHRPALLERLRPQPAGGRPGGHLLPAPRQPHAFAGADRKLWVTGSAGGRRVRARDNDVPVLHLAKPDRTRWDDRKLDHVRPYFEAAERAGHYGVVAIVAAQEFQWVFMGYDRTKARTARRCTSTSPRPNAGHCVLLLHPRPRVGARASSKICTYFP